MTSAPPEIFAPSRRMAARRRILAAQRRTDAARYLIDDMVEDVLDRIGFIRLEPKRAFVIGDWSGQVAAALKALGSVVTEADVVALPGTVPVDLEVPYPSDLTEQGYDFITCLGGLESVNDLPGALIHMHRALAPGGFVLASMIGGGSLPNLRHAFITADGDRPAARLHPQVDVRAAAQLIQRAGWADPVVDSHGLKVRYGSLERLVEDLRAQGLTNSLASSAPAIGKAGLARARAAFAAAADESGKVTEYFEIVTLSGRRR